MNKTTLPLLTAIATAAFVFAGSAHAQDKATLDLLVRKGVITAAEADQLVNETKSKDVSKKVEAKGPDTKRITIGGLVQTQYQFLSVDGKTTNASGVSSDNEPANTNRFELRRAQIDFDAKIGSDWNAFVSFIAEDGASARDYLDKAGITYSTDFGKLTAGLRKVNFAVEEYTSSSKLFAIERSIATNYFAGGVKPGTLGSRLGFASRHVGVYWDGALPGADGLEYGLSVTSGYQNSVSSATAVNNQVNVWAYAQYTLKIDDTTNIQVGFNFGWQPGDDTYTVSSEPDSEVIGYNPFIKATMGGASLQGEFLGAWVKHGAADGSDASPYGVNATAAYRFGDIEPVVRYSYLQGDGRGFSNKDVWRSSPSTGKLYDEAWTIFAGVNYYLMKDTVKISAGYEHARFSGAPAANNGSASRANGDGVRVQLQAIF
ncbi:MAG: OprO/OprP family phosphate-selective porin [Puniceicoccales bacterium]|jgi:phosphate-selective porin|nr:OprO/OprP family phosphate-selective porin [Puniceicoccales bacterium]